MQRLQHRQVEIIPSTGKDGKTIIPIVSQTFLVHSEMSANGRIWGLFQLGVIADVKRHMLFDSGQKPFSCSAYVPAIAVAHELIYNITLFRAGRISFLAAVRIGLEVRITRGEAVV